VEGRQDACPNRHGHNVGCLSSETHGELDAAGPERPRQRKLKYQLDPLDNNDEDVSALLHFKSAIFNSNK